MEYLELQMRSLDMPTFYLDVVGTGVTLPTKNEWLKIYHSNITDIVLEFITAILEA